MFAVLLYRPPAAGSASLSSALAEDLRRIEAHRGPGLAVVLPRSGVREPGRAAGWRLGGYRYAAGAAVGAAATIDFKSLLYAVLAAVIIDILMRRASATSAGRDAVVEPVERAGQDGSAVPVEIADLGTSVAPVRTAGSTEPTGQSAETDIAVEPVQVVPPVPVESAGAVVPSGSGDPAVPLQSARSTEPTGQSAA